MNYFYAANFFEKLIMKYNAHWNISCGRSAGQHQKNITQNSVILVRPKKIKPMISKKKSALDIAGYRLFQCPSDGQAAGLPAVHPRPRCSPPLLKDSLFLFWKFICFEPFVNSVFECLFLMFISKIFPVHLTDITPGINEAFWIAFSWLFSVYSLVFLNSEIRKNP